MSKAFASTGDLGPKQISFGEIGPGCYAFTAEGDPNSGVIVGDDGVVVIDTQATPAMAQQSATQAPAWRSSTAPTTASARPCRSTTASADGPRPWPRSTPASSRR